MGMLFKEASFQFEFQEARPHETFIASFSPNFKFKTVQKLKLAKQKALIR
jgi:hypothetical protein